MGPSHVALQWRRQLMAVQAARVLKYGGNLVPCCQAFSVRRMSLAAGHAACQRQQSDDCQADYNGNRSRKFLYKHFHLHKTAEETSWPLVVGCCWSGIGKMKR